MIRPALLAAVLLAALATTLPATPCDGTPPELKNTDPIDHPYELTCGRKTEQTTIPASTTQSLEGKSGCKLILGDSPPPPPPPRG